jgi:hypothetical protein
VGVCTSQGHFAVSLSDSYLLTDPNGGWSPTANPLLFPNGLPIITVAQIQTQFGAVPGTLATPEPATLGLVGVALAGLAWIRKRRRRAAET